VNETRDFSQVLEKRDGNGNLLVRYVYGHDLISQTRPSASSGAYPSFYHYDGLGSTRALTNTSEAVTDTYSYDAFGNLLDKTGTTTNTYLFTGEFFDTQSGFYYLRARYMNPAIGQFITMDMLAGRHRDPSRLHTYGAFVKNFYASIVLEHAEYAIVDKILGLSKSIPTFLLKEQQQIVCTVQSHLIMALEEFNLKLQNLASLKNPDERRIRLNFGGVINELMLWPHCSSHVVIDIEASHMLMSGFVL